jgi:hypothetical protein
MEGPIMGRGSLERNKYGHTAAPCEVVNAAAKREVTQA